MGRKTKVLEVRVEVRPRQLGNLGVVHTSDSFIEPDEKKRIERYRKRCQGIVRDIERRVGDVGHARVVEDTASVCEYCGATWTEGADSNHNGGCCEEDAKSLSTTGNTRDKQPA